MRRRHAPVLLAALACLAPVSAPAAAHAAATRANWDPAEQRTVASAGVLPNLPGGFQGGDPLSPSQLGGALSAIARRTGTHSVTVAPTTATVTVTTFHRLVVKQLGLADLARSIQKEATRAGLAPPARFGTEVVARQLGLRFDHPAQDDALELYPTDPITRAEAAYSFARVLANPTGNPYYARQVFASFRLPAYSDAQKRVLHIAVSKIGMPYVWGGESDTSSSRYGPQAHGGYDCSGFVWRVFKLSNDPAGAKIGGRTAAAMANEIPRQQRIGFGAIEAGDLLFFYPPGISHVGIALGGGFFIQSSGQGVNVASLTESWRRADFAWARRVL